MPKYPDSELLKYKGRSYTNLEVSEGDAPAGVFIPSSAEATKFVYSFGPEVGREVVIPKGKIVSFAGREWDAETTYYRPALKIAGTSDVPAGVAPHNVYKRRRDAFSDSETFFLTRAYIQVPVIISTTSAADATTKAAAIKYGATWAYDANANTAANNLLGKYLMADANGNYQIADAAGIQAGKVVGQCLDIDNTLPPEGWLQFAFGLERSELADMIRRDSFPASAGADPKLGFFDMGAFPLGSTYTDAKNKLLDWNKGLPFLTDGYFRSRKVVSGMTIDNIDPATMDPANASALTTGTAYGSTADQYQAVEYVRTAGDVVVDANGCVTVADPRGAMLFIKLKHEIANGTLEVGDSVSNYPELGGIENKVTVKLRTDGGATFTDATVDTANVHIDYEHKMIVVYFPSAVATSKVLVEATCLINKVPGLPTMQDFQNCFGIARILLQR